MGYNEKENGNYYSGFRVRSLEGPIRPFSIGSSHCLTQYGCKS